MPDEQHHIMKTKITLEIETNLLWEARILATREGTAVGALLGAMLEDAVRQRKAYSQARLSAMARLQSGFEMNWTPPCSRDDLHER